MVGLEWNRVILRALVGQDGVSLDLIIAYVALASSCSWEDRYLVA